MEFVNMDLRLNSKDSIEEAKRRVRKLRDLPSATVEQLDELRLMQGFLSWQQLQDQVKSCPCEGDIRARAVFALHREFGVWYTERCHA